MNVKVYVALEGDYDDRGAVAVCSTHEKAIAALVSRETERRAYLHRMHFSDKLLPVEPSDFKPYVQEFELDVVPGWQP